jgi:hypothetical protein
MKYLPFFLNILKGGEKMKSRILLSVIIIGAVIGGTFLVTRAYLRANQTATGSKIAVGTLDMDVDGNRGTAIDPFVVENIGEEGNISGTKTWTVNNTGSLPGRLYFRLNDVINYDNECNEPELLVDSTCGAPGADEGELGSKLSFKVYLGDELVSTSNLTKTDMPTIRQSWNDLPAVLIPAGQSKTVKVEYSAGENDYGNEIQSDSITFDARFDLVQTTVAEPTP